MPISISQLANNTAIVTLPIDEENSITVVFFPAKVTEKTFIQLNALTATDENSILEGFVALNSMLSTLIKSWDLYEDDEQKVMYPVDPESLSALPIAFRMNIMFAIMNNIRPEAMATQTKN